MPRKKTSRPPRVSATKADDLPATRRMLQLVRDELKEGQRSATARLEKQIGNTKEELKNYIDGLRSEVKNDIVDAGSKLKNEISVLKVEVNREFKEFKKELNVFKKELYTATSEVKQMIHRTNLLVEEQNANNRIVLDGLLGLWQRQDRVEEEFTYIKEQLPPSKPK